MTKYLTAALVLFLAASCGNDQSPAGPRTKILTLAPSVAWIDSGVVMKEGQIVEIFSDDDALGALFVRPDDPLITSRHGGLIGRIGEGIRPFWIGTGLVIMGNSANEGEALYLGRNDTDFSTTTSGPLAYQPFTLTVTVSVSPNDRNKVALVAPMNGSYSSDGSPIFDWDDVDNTVQYRLQLSQYPDFRVVEQDINTTTSSQNPFAAPPGSNVQPLAPLGAGVHYWRVRAYVNVGRVTAPILEWGDWSEVFTYGVQIIGLPPTPTVTNPPQGASFALGDTVLFEFTAPPMGSGLLWSYVFTSTTCGNIPSFTSFTSADGTPYPWYVFPTTILTSNPNQIPLEYASFSAVPDLPGEWLYRIETRAGSDLNASTLNFFNVRFSAGCP